MAADRDQKIREAYERGPWRQFKPPQETGFKILRDGLPRKLNHGNWVEKHVHYLGRK